MKKSRKPTKTGEKKKMGIKTDEVIEYWRDRAEQSKSAAVGFDAKNLTKQDERYGERNEFLFGPIDTSIHTLDYGCGIGRYSSMFDNYLGVDITLELLKIAKRNNPTKKYMQLSHPFLTKTHKDYSKVAQIITTTVLQHCEDKLVQIIFDSMFEHIKQKGLVFSIYEKDDGISKPHVASRSPVQYGQMIQEAGYVAKFMENKSHMIHGEKHTLTIIGV